MKMTLKEDFWQLVMVIMDCTSISLAIYHISNIIRWVQDPDLLWNDIREEVEILFLVIEESDEDFQRRVNRYRAEIIDERLRAS